MARSSDHYFADSPGRNRNRQKKDLQFMVFLLSIGSAFVGFLSRGIDAMLREWMPDSGMQLDARPFLEYYPTDATFDPKTGVSSCDIAIPVAPL